MSGGRILGSQVLLGEAVTLDETPHLSWALSLLLLRYKYSQPVKFKIQIQPACKSCSPNPARIHTVTFAFSGLWPLHALFPLPGMLFLPFCTGIAFYDPLGLNLNFSLETTLKNWLPPVSLSSHSPVTLIALNTLYLSIYSFCLSWLNFKLHERKTVPLDHCCNSCTPYARHKYLLSEWIRVPYVHQLI